MIGAVALFIMLGGIFSLMLRGRIHPWNPRLANMKIQSTRGPNLATVLAVAGLATMLLKAAQLPFVVARPGLVPWLVGGTFALIVGYIVLGSVTKLLVGGLGIALLVLTEGVGGAIQILIVVILLLWLLGAVRGWVG